MSGLAKALLYEIDSSNAGNPIGPRLQVQFNPASLKLSFNNRIDGGKTKGRQTRQYIGKSSTELSFDLVFDTADETSDDGTPRSVRERTDMVERFVRPKGTPGQKQVVPRVRFHWGDLIVDGVIESLAIDFELFSPGGVPLRAKMGVQIREQDAKQQYLSAGPGANTQLGPPTGGGAGAGGGGLGGGIGNPFGGGGAGGGAAGGGGAGGGAARSGEAQQGESLAEFAARNGLDPNQWRALAEGIDNPLELPAGLEVKIPASVAEQPSSTATPALATTRDAATVLDPSASATRDGGRALAAAGGVVAALSALAAAASSRAAAREREAFAAPAAAPAGGSVPAEPPGALRRGLDARVIAFGHGVPLRPRFGGAPELRELLLTGGVTLGAERTSEVIVPVDPTQPAWKRLPPADAGRTAADMQQRRHRPKQPCGCGSGPGGRGGCGCQCT